MLCCKDGGEELTLTVKVTPKQGGKDEREPLCEGSPACLPDSKAGASTLHYLCTFRQRFSGLSGEAGVELLGGST